MKAVVVQDGTGAARFIYQEVPQPEIGPTEVLVRVRAAALNHLEVWDTLRRPRDERQPIPGSDVAGVVEAVGSAVTGWEPGAKVMLQPAISCGNCQRCLEGNDNLCPSYHLLGRGCDGGLAEFVKVPVASLIPMPENLTFPEAASIPLVFQTAWHMLATRARLRLGEDVLVNAAGSGVGIAAIQIAKLFGARVIASAGSDAKLEKARALGADAVINYNTQDLAQEALRLTGGKGVDLVFENVGGDVLSKSLEALARNGRVVTCGTTAGGRITVDVTRLFLRHQALIGSFMGTKAELLEAVPYFAQGRLKAVVHRVYPLREIQAAVTQLASRDHFGKIVLVPD